MHPQTVALALNINLGSAMQICYGQKECPHSEEVQMSADSAAPPQQSGSNAKVSREGQSIRAFYSAEILHVAEASRPSEYKSGEVAPSV